MAKPKWEEILPASSESNVEERSAETECDFTQSSPVTARIHFKVLPDGTLIDLVRDPENSEKLKLAVWKKGAATIKADFTSRSQRFLPVEVPAYILKAVRLPSGLKEFKSVRHLLIEINELITTYVHFEDSLTTMLIPACVLSTWVADRLASYPYLSICGPLGSGKSTLLRLLQATCRRGIILSDHSSATLRFLPGLLKPTLLLDECDFNRTTASKEIQRILRAGNVEGLPSAAGRMLFDVACPKVLSSREGIADAALASRAVHISMMPTTQFKRTLNMAALESKISQLHSKLLMFRLCYFQKIITPAHLVNGAHALRVNDLALSLVAPLIDYPDIQIAIVESFDKQDQQARESRADDPEWIVVEALIEQLRRRMQVIYHAGEIAAAIKARGDTNNLTPRRVGSILRHLGFSLHRDNKGFGIVNNSSFVVRLQQQAKILGIDI